jgi:acyl-CoA thioesterase
MSEDGRFARDTAVHRDGDGAFTARLDGAWWIGPGPNGGYLAAIVLRAMMAQLAQPVRAPRSLTVHYASAPREGEVSLAVAVQRSGRSASNLSVRMTQDGRTIVLALGVLATAYPSALDFAEARAPAVPAPAEVPAVAPRSEQPAFSRRFELRPALGRWFGDDPSPAGDADAPATGTDGNLTGGWLRLAAPRALDAPLLAALTDAWVPVPFLRLGGFCATAPTLDLTVHFRAAPPPEPDAHVLAVFRSHTSRDGFFEEDGELFAADGTLLVQSRQLALLRPV